LPLSTQIVMILTRKESFWQAVPVYGDFFLQQQVTSFAFCGMAVLLIGTWVLVNNLRLLYLAIGVAVVIGFNTILETMITYANVRDVRDLVAGIIGVAVHLGLIAAMARFGILPNLQKNSILKEESLIP